MSWKVPGVDNEMEDDVSETAERAMMYILMQSTKSGLKRHHGGVKGERGHEYHHLTQKKVEWNCCLSTCSSGYYAHSLLSRLAGQLPMHSSNRKMNMKENMRTAFIPR